MSDTNATVELSQADLQRSVASSFCHGIEKVVGPLLDKHIASLDADITGLREQIFANLDALKPAEDTRKVHAFHVVTLNTDSGAVQGRALSGTATPKYVGEEASTATGALRNLLDVTQKELQSMLFGADGTTKGTIHYTPPSTPAKCAKALSAHTTTTSHTVINSSVGTAGHHVRMSSTDMRLWDSDQIKNPFFAEFMASPELKGDPGLARKLSGDTIAGSARSRGDFADDATVADVGENVVEHAKMKAVQEFNGKGGVFLNGKGKGFHNSATVANVKVATKVKAAGHVNFSDAVKTVANVKPADKGKGIAHDWPAEMYQAGAHCKATGTHSMATGTHSKATAKLSDGAHIKAAIKGKPTDKLTVAEQVKRNRSISAHDHYYINEAVARRLF